VPHFFVKTARKTMKETTNDLPAPLVLASASPYRRALLERFQLPFLWEASAIDETPLLNEAADTYSLRLAEAKARAVAAKYPEAWVIGSDQCLLLNKEILGKGGSREGAFQQLTKISGQKVLCYTAFCLFQQQTEQKVMHLDLQKLHMRILSPAEIDRYLDKEAAFDVAGSLYSEGLGISLLESLENQDPSGLIGLPLIALAKALRQVGFAVP
jgi:septum formation protein